MVNIILKLALINDMVDFFAHALNSTVCSNLTDDELVESTLAELETLVDRLT